MTKDLRFSLLDFKVGFRMLTRYPGLTVVGGLAMAFAIWIGACTFELITQYTNPNIPLPTGDRLVGLQLTNVATRDRERHALYDFTVWRAQLKAVEALSAYTTSQRNLITDEGPAEAVEVARISVSGFRLAGVKAQLGRVLLDSDEAPGATPVAVIGHEIWQRAFAGDPNVIGRTIRLGNEIRTVVGVMPQGFGFPVRQEVWIPFQLNAFLPQPGGGPAISVIGRLAPGVSLQDAQTELTAIGQRLSADFPATHKHIRPRVLRYAAAILPVPESESAGLRVLNLFVIVLVLLMCGNVALLMFARAATRESEIVVRSALGASRSRIIMQLLAESLVLGAVAAIVGIAAARYGLRWALFVLEENLGRLPFWLDDSISQLTWLYAAGLMLLGALVTGVLPGLRLTRTISERLRQASAGGGGLKFSGIWTVIIVAQVAVTLLFPVTAFLIHRAKGPIEAQDIGFASAEYLSVRLELDRETALGVTGELERQLSSDPAVLGVSFADRLPRMVHTVRRVNVLDAVTLSPDSVVGQPVKTAAIDLDYFEVLGANIRAGRAFAPTDRGARVVIVNQSFVTRVLKGRNAVGRHVRFTTSDPSAELAPTFEIVGVVGDLGMNYLGRTSNNAGAGIYHPLPESAPSPLFMVVKVRNEPAAFAPRLQAIAQSVDPTLRLYDILPMNQLHAGVLQMLSVYIRTAMLISGIALLLSLAGIYAVMAFTVTQRTREIGVRVALGARPGQVARAIFRRPLSQVGLGVAVGAWLVGTLTRSVLGDLSTQELVLLLGYAVLMMGVCMIACVVPMRRALTIEPTDALRLE